MKKVLFISIILISVFMLYSCDTQQYSNEDTKELKEAMLQGREAGRILVNREWKDSIQLQYYILEAKAKQSKYIIEGKTKSAEAFDRGFVSMIRCVNPQLANLIFPDSLLNIR